jgi:hypothetical protein
MLKKHVENAEKDVQAFFISGWNQDNSGWEDHLAGKLSLRSLDDFYEGKWIFFDSAELSYRDGEHALWHVFIKEHNRSCRVFATTGNYYSARNSEWTLQCSLTQVWLIQLCSYVPKYHSVGHGLALIRQESDRFIVQNMSAGSPPIQVEDRLHELIFTWTCGHIGVIIAPCP